jgi:chromosome segregation ATPase
MPEITSVEAIRTKLREFDERVDGAVAAAKTLARVKGDAEQLLKGLEGMSTRGEQALQKADSIRLKFQELQSEWDGLKQEVAKAQTKSKETRDLLLSELDSAIQSLGKKLAEAEDRLRSANRASLSEQGELLKRLDSETRKNADIAEQAKTAAMERAAKLEQLLATLRDELQGDFRTKLLHAEDLLESQFQEFSKELNEQSANHGRLLHSEINAFKDEMKRDLAEHQQAIDRQLTDFLNKQNALIQNLSQQIDSFQRVSQTQSADLAATNARLNELTSAFNEHKTRTRNEQAALAEEAGALRKLLVEVQAELGSQRESIDALGSSLEATTTRLNQTLDKLRQLPLVGSKFR